MKLAYVECRLQLHMSCPLFPGHHQRVQGNAPNHAEWPKFVAKFSEFSKMTPADINTVGMFGY